MIHDVLAFSDNSTADEAMYFVLAQNLGVLIAGVLEDGTGWHWPTQMKPRPHATATPYPHSTRSDPMSRRAAIDGTSSNVPVAICITRS